VLNSIEYFLSDLILVTCNDFTRAYFKPLPQLSRSQLPPYVTGRYINSGPLSFVYVFSWMSVLHHSTHQPLAVWMPTMAGASM
jgi:hypothetical protein